MMNRRNHHGGERRASSDTLRYDLSVSLNPLGMPQSAWDALEQSTEVFRDYPDTECTLLREAIAGEIGAPAEHIVCGNGASDLIYRLCQTAGFQRVLLAVPSFTEYERALVSSGVQIEYLQTSAEKDFSIIDEYEEYGSGYDAIFISDPVNPSGKKMEDEDRKRLHDWCRRTGTMLVVDECFLDFVRTEQRMSGDRWYRSPDLYHDRNFAPFAGPDSNPDKTNDPAQRPLRFVSIRSFTKVYAMAGLRIGYMICSEKSLADEIASYGPPWAVSGPAQTAAAAALGDPDHVQRTLLLMRKEREAMTAALRLSGLTVFRSDVNYLLVQAHCRFGEKMEQQGIRVRDCSEMPGLAPQGRKRYFRLSIGLPEQNREVLKAVESAADSLEKAMPIMIQGSMSNAGKSLIAAGLCRIFHQDGYRTVPFKSQNMALNSFITEDGGEMGRAQVVQAEAAGVSPSCDMNPVLLKPVTDEGSQVIVNGKVRADMKAAEYFRRKQELLPEIMDAYGRLAEDADIIVIEGAGSPVEMNLRSGDLVNMGMADRADSPVLLVGDIDRGGIFPQLKGTVDLLTDEERRRVKGLIVNRFRGDRALFEEGRRMLEEMTGIPVLGVVPYLDIDLDDEDSITERFQAQRAPEDEIDICVIHLPHISNFSDFTVLDAAQGMHVRYVDRPEQLSGVDAIILPGSKNTIGDLEWLHQSGIARQIRRAADMGITVVGICGGYQMLGLRITDPEGVESSSKAAQGLGLLPVSTVLEKEKQTVQTSGTVGSLSGPLAPLSGLSFSGYEIHMGRTSAEPSAVRIVSGNVPTPFAQLESETADGYVQGSVMGSYVHGLFDRIEFCQAFADILSERSGKAPAVAEDYQAYRERQYDQLAEALRESLDLEAVYRILGMKEGKTE